MNISKINISPVCSIKKAFENCTPFSKSKMGNSSDTFIKTVDIYSQGEFPVGTLSNFTESHFTFEGKQINSMEGFLQSLKTADVTEQEQICRLVGPQAKKAGSKLKAEPGYNPEILHWNGKLYERNSKEYQDLLIRVYDAKYEADGVFRKALKATRGCELKHSIGKNSTAETILTEKEFVDILTNLRDKNYIKRFKIQIKEEIEKIKHYLNNLELSNIN